MWRAKKLKLMAWYKKKVWANLKILCIKLIHEKVTDSLGPWQTWEHEHSVWSYQSGRRCRSPPGSWPCLWDLCRGSNEERGAALTWAAGLACTESVKRISVSWQKIKWGKHFVILVILQRCPQKGPGWRWWRYCWCRWRGWCMTTRRRPCWGRWI